MPDRLRSLSINRVAFVPKGDNPDAEVVFWKSSEPFEKAYTTAQRVEMAKKGQAIPVKSADGTITDGRYPIANAVDLNNATRALGRGNESDRSTIIAHIKKRARALGLSDSLNPDIYGKAQKRMTSSRQSRLRAALDALGSVIDETTEPTEGGEMGDADKQYQLPDDADDDLKKFVETLQKERDDAVGERDEAKAELEKSSQPAPDPNADPIAKALADPETPAHVKVALEKARDAEKRAAEADERVAKMEEERATDSKIAKARELKHLSLKPEDIGPLLRKIEKADPDAATEIERVLTSADALASEAFTEIGKGGESESTQRLDEMAKEYAKAHDVTPSQAMIEVVKTPEGREAYAAAERDRKEG